MKRLARFKHLPYITAVFLLCTVSVFNSSNASAVLAPIVTPGSDDLNSIVDNRPFYDPTATACTNSGQAPQSGFTPDTTDADKVVAASNATIGYAVYDSEGNQVAKNSSYQSENYGASITKSMLLVAYLNQAGAAALSAQAKTNLTAMIENSDNAAANWVYNNLKNPQNAVTTVANNAGMTGFKFDTSDPQYILGQSQITADDFAKFFAQITEADGVNIWSKDAQRAFGLGLLTNITQNVGLLQSGLPATVYSKEGWKTEPAGTAGSPWIVNQAANFTLNNITYGVAVTVAGAPDQGTGEDIIKNVVSALISTATAAAPAGGAVTGNISPLAGQGMSAKAQQLFQQYAVAAGQKNNVDPNFVAAFYYVERGHTGDSTNNADAANGTPAAGDGQWLEPAPPVGTGRPYITNGLGYSEPYGLSQYDKTTYGEDGDGDGTIDLYDLADAMFTAANFLVQVGHASANMTDAQMYNAAHIYNNSDSYAQSIVNIVHYLEKGGSGTVTGSTGTGGCAATLTGSTSCQGINQVSGTAKILAAAKCWAGIYYEFGGAHADDYTTYAAACPDPGNPPVPPAVPANETNQATGGPLLDGGPSGNPSPCGVDCSSLVSLAVDRAFGLNYMWTVTGTMNGDGAQYWQSIPWNEAQQGDIVTNSEHVEIVESVDNAHQTVMTWGAHETGTVVSPGNNGQPTAFSYYPDGVWRWTGPQGGGGGTPN